MLRLANVDPLPRPSDRVLRSVLQAAQAKNFDLALSKIDQIQIQLTAWRDALAAAKLAADSPAEPEKVPEPPAESVPFSINVTHTPVKCPRKSAEGATMKVHYVGKLVATGKIFASSFHTGSQPFRFILGSDEVLPAWNDGLSGMCEGERRRLMVPWNMGYGAKGGKGVPAYSDLQVSRPICKRHVLLMCTADPVPHCLLRCQYDFELVEMNLPKIPKGKKDSSKKAEL